MLSFKALSPEMSDMSHVPVHEGDLCYRVIITNSPAYFSDNIIYVSYSTDKHDKQPTRVYVMANL